MHDATYSIGLVVEAEADARTVRTLIDRRLQEGIDWLDAEMLDGIRGWRGIEAELPFTEWTRTASLAREHRIQSLGAFDGKPGKPYAIRAFKTLRLFAKLGMPDAVVLIVDADDQPDRWEGLDQARGTHRQHAHVVIGVANPEREAWIISGFVPNGEGERGRITAERRRLGFDPTRRTHELGRGKRDAKLVLRNLLGQKYDR